MKLAFIGGGNMAQAMLSGLKTQQLVMSDITVVELDVNKHDGLQQQFSIKATSDLADTVACDAIVLAVKPQQLPDLTKTLAPLLTTQLIISIAAGIRLQDLSAWLNDYQIIVRTMPNTPAQIQAGITGLYAHPAVSKAQIAIADQILRAAGETIWVDSEEKLDAVTAISGSGPAYVFYFIEALQAAAQSLNLSESEAKKLSLATFKGASLLADVSETSVARLREQVTSKGGTTEQGLLSLENSKVKEAIKLAAELAYKRAKSLGDELGKMPSDSK
ncbi:MAG: pyrroline-5-carboxylate reductase [Betaproteobacteria bacterium]|jgi:pyrroline-5-carboxylate reductase|nr:pyrroline-5-carboxylate reductase [Betaproteobacteria bacterium]MCH9849309.1 pyrroline-5-carboxylate reductase [Betaproteobacteria bacterium]MDG1097112.1 pyrroline-5-carboxylate reductase [Methylophilaceae bacterium]MDG1452867.1 pyrroline-5-carboxylate reductase [Methylophilaceae bacterium]